MHTAIRRLTDEWQGTDDAPRLDAWAQGAQLGLNSVRVFAGIRYTPEQQTRLLTRRIDHEATTMGYSETLDLRDFLLGFAHGYESGREILRGYADFVDLPARHADLLAEYERLLAQK
jgi:hypothetical protein